MTLATTDLDVDAARRITDDIKDSAEGLLALVVEAYKGRVWLPLGYESWDAWKQGELADIELPRDAIPALKAHGMPTRAIGTVTGVSKDTVNRAVSNETPEKVTGLDGKTYGAHNPKTNVFYCRFRDCDSSFPYAVKHCPQCASHYVGYIHDCKKPVELPVAEQKNPALYTSDSDDWWTPTDIIDRTIAALGTIDLDPCSNLGTPNVEASSYFTINDDGLAQPWVGRVYMNPPYGDVLPAWVSKLVNEYNMGNVEQAVALVPARTDTRWFRELRPFLRCFIWGRLKFSGQANSAPFPSMAVYLGQEDRKFIDAFSPIGDVFGVVE